MMLDGDTYLPRSTKTGRTLVVRTSSGRDRHCDAEEESERDGVDLRKATAMRAGGRQNVSRWASK